MNLIETLEKEEIARLSEGKTFPKMNPGDTVVVNSTSLKVPASVFRLSKALSSPFANRGLNSASPS